MGNIFHIIGIAIVAFIPMVIWGYIFSYLDNSLLNSRRFLAGMLAGGISVVPVLYMEDILRFLGFEKWSVFSFIQNIGNVSVWSSFIPIVLLLFVVAILLYLVLGAIFFDRTLSSTKIYLKNLFLLLSIPFLFVIVSALTDSLGIFTHQLQGVSASFGKYIFSTLQMVVLYYIIVGVLEEVSKHFSFLGSSLVDIDSVKKGALLSVFIALGFGFIENILYLSTILSTKGLSSDLMTTWIFRSVFSVFVHIFCGIIVASAFGRAYLVPLNAEKFGRYMKVFLFGIFSSIGIHAIYDVGLTFGFTAIIFIYLIVGYFYCTGVFYRDPSQMS